MGLKYSKPLQMQADFWFVNLDLDEERNHVSHLQALCI